MSWVDNAEGTAVFQIERKAGPSGTYAPITTTARGITSYTDSTVVAGIPYCYRVRASNAHGDSGYSNEACGSVAAAHDLTVVRAGSGSGTVLSTPSGINCGADCVESYPGGTVVTLTATPSAGSTFVGWSGAGCGATAPCVLTGNTPVTVTATFSPLTAAQPSVTASPASVTAGSTVTVTWSGLSTPSPTDWIGLYAPGTANTSYLGWTYVSCSRTKTLGSAGASGSCPFLVPAGLASGVYQMRLFAGSGYVRLATSETFTVTAGPGGQASVSASPASVAAGNTVTVTWSGISTPSPTDWIGLYAPGAAETGYLGWIYVNCTKSAGLARASGSCPLLVPAGLASGTYQVRLFTDDGYARLATSNALMVP